MYFSGRSTAERYGEIIAWDDDDAAFQDMYIKTAMQPGLGLVLLEIQARLYSFLVDCCKLILHDIPADAFTSDAYPIQSEVGIAEEKTAGFASLAVMAAEAPYQVPAKFDIARLRSFFSARIAAAEDHIWSLREDPNYYAESLIDLSEHQTERLKDLAVMTHPVFKSVSAEMFSDLHIQSDQLCELHAKHNTGLKPDKGLPQDYLLALLQFRYSLIQVSKGLLASLRNSTLSSPPMRPYFVRMPEERQRLKHNISRNPNVKLDSTHEQLMRLLRVLWEDDYLLFLISQTVAVDELERLLRSEPKAREMISCYVASVIPDLSVVTEATQQLRIFQLWAQTFENAMVDNDDLIKGDYAVRTKHMHNLSGIVKALSQSQLNRLSVPVGRKFYYPVDKRRTKDNVEAMRSAEQSLDAIWTEMDRVVQMKLGEDLRDTAVWRVLYQARIMQQTRSG
ncbi:hypothetical protein LTR56_023070 [Elasticomyces elasticus]|nr:hypothetical protein LTR56_023070 [Elasticomyces elasticus]KAK3623347.1 hypothetical protein LTR22_024426 [Elasticomyces elasticus]KAK4907291.1 hypothetical protein LTR49_023661 [Elasticomyces elasticus]KAK5747769.1 hypothetical protein LTS12_022168 [Elasticomyces elasticus]